MPIHLSVCLADCLTDAVKAAEAATIGAGMLGAQAIVEMARGADDEARLHMWLRAGLNEGCLGARLAALWKNRELYEQWYDRYLCLLSCNTVLGMVWPSVLVNCKATLYAQI